MRRFFFVLILLAALLGPADFWEKKKYTEWNQKEVQAMLHDSLWAGMVEIMTEGGRVSLSKGGSGDHRSSIGDPSREVGGAGRVNVLVRFHSAQPMKQAIARARFGDKVLESPEAARMLAQPEPSYVIAIAGPPRLMPADAARAARPSCSSSPAAARLPARGRQRRTAREVSGFALNRRFKLKEMVFGGKLEI